MGAAPEAGGPAAATAAPAASSARAPFVALDFDQAEVGTVVHTVSEILGFNYVLAPDVVGKITARTAGRIPRDDAFAVLVAILEVHGFTAVYADGLHKIVRVEGAAQRAVPTIVGPDPETTRGVNEVITQIVHLRFARAAGLIAFLQPLMSRGRQLTVHGEANLLAITDVAANIRRLLDIIRLVDVETALDAPQVIPIRFASAADLATLFNARRRTDARPAERPAVVVAEPRSNSLLVHAPRHELEAIRRLIAQLDVPLPGERRVSIYALEHVKAKDLAATLTALHAGSASGAAPTPRPPRVIADETTNGIIVTTFPRDWPEIESTIKELDRRPRQAVIDVRVVEVTLTDETRLGIDWAARIDAARFISLTSTTVLPILMPPSVPLPVVGAGFTFLGVAGEASDIFLKAVASQNRVNLISTSTVLVADNHKAVINVSDSIPIVTAGQVPTSGTAPVIDVLTGFGTVTQTVEYRDVGVVLTVTPRIGEGGTVALDIKPEVSDLGPAEPPTGSRRIIKRALEASTVLRSNQTLVLGGLIRERRATEERGIPLLKDIPLLGAAFRTTTWTLDRTELLVLITPRVIAAPGAGLR